MKNAILLKTGIAGSAIAALCCFTPVLVILFAAVGLSAWVDHLDAVLMPALLFFLVLTVYAFVRKNKKDGCESEHDQ